MTRGFPDSMLTSSFQKHQEAGMMSGQERAETDVSRPLRPTG